VQFREWRVLLVSVFIFAQNMLIFFLIYNIISLFSTQIIETFDGHPKLFPAFWAEF